MAALRNCIEANGWRSIEHLFDAMNKSIDYCILRNTEDVTSEFAPEIHGDIDILVRDYSAAIKFMCASKVHSKPFRVCYKVKVAGEFIAFDIRYVGDNYYCEKWETDILNSKKLVSNKGVSYYMMSPEHQYYSLLYHVYLQKKSVSLDYPSKLDVYAKRANVSYVNEVSYVMHQLSDFMQTMKYEYVLPHDLDVVINWPNLKYINNYKRIKIADAFTTARIVYRSKTTLSKIKSNIKKIKCSVLNLGKRTFFKADRLLFNGKIRNKLYHIEVVPDVDPYHEFLRGGKPYYIADLDKQATRTKILRISVRDFITMQTYYPNRFRSWVMAIHVLYLEYLEGKNSIGMDYEKALQTYIYGKFDMNGFNKKIHDIRSCNWENVEPIVADRDMRMIEGALRLAIAYHDKVDFIKVRCCDFLLRWRYVYGRDYLLTAGFSADELEIVDKKVETILVNSRFQNTCIIWPPAQKIYDELLKTLSEYEPDNIVVHDCWDTVMTFDELKGFIAMAYKKDDALTWALKMKSRFMHKASQVKDGRYPMRFVRIEMKNPDYIVKPISGQPYSQESLRCKETLREMYKNKVEFYERDVIIHISDNFLQSNYLWLLSHLNRDLSGLFKRLDIEKVSFTAMDAYGRKYENGYMSFIFGEDAQVIIYTSISSVEKANQVVDRFVHEQYTDEWIRLEKADNECKILLDNECVLLIRIESYAD